MLNSRRMQPSQTDRCRGRSDSTATTIALMFGSGSVCWSKISKGAYQHPFSPSVTCKAKTPRDLKTRASAVRSAGDVRSKSVLRYLITLSIEASHHCELGKPGECATAWRPDGVVVPQLNKTN